MQVIHPYEAHRRRIRNRNENRPTVRLNIVRGVTKHPVRRIDRPLFVIGRAADCDLVLSDPQFADHHAYILQRNGQITLRHLGAAPLITVNQRWMRWGELKHGDRIRTGPYEFTLCVVPAPAAAGPCSSDNPANSSNRTALENLPIFDGVSSTAERPSSDENREPICWIDGRLPTGLFPSLDPWNKILSTSRLKDWW